MDEELYTPASASKRVFAYIIDFILFVVCGMLLNKYVTSVYYFDARGGNSIANEMYQLVIDTNMAYATYEGDNISMVYLYNYAPDGVEDKEKGYIATPKGNPAYEVYLDLVWDYYTSFYPTDTRIVKDASITDYYKYTLQEIFSLPADGSFYSDKNAYFQYAKDSEGNIDYTAKPVLLDSVSKALENENTKKSILESLRDYFLKQDTYMFSYTYSGVYYDAVINLEKTQSYFTDRYNQITNISWEATAIAYAPFALIFFLLIPTLEKKGRGIGKLIFGSMVVKEGDASILPWWKRLLRNVIVTAELALLLIPYNGPAVMAYAAVIILDFAFFAFSRSGKGTIHDRIIGSAVINKKGSPYDKKAQKMKGKIDNVPNN